jgi:hypothetical protein
MPITSDMGEKGETIIGLDIKLSTLEDFILFKFKTLDVPQNKL